MRVIRFPAGVTNVTVPINTVEDEIYEADGTFFVILSSPTNGLRVDNSIVVVQIMDNDRKSVMYTDVKISLLLEVQPKQCVGLLYATKNSGPV